MFMKRTPYESAQVWTFEEMKNEHLSNPYRISYIN